MLISDGSNVLDIDNVYCRSHLGSNLFIATPIYRRYNYGRFRRTSTAGKKMMKEITLMKNSETETSQALQAGVAKDDRATINSNLMPNKKQVIDLKSKQKGSGKSEPGIQIFRKQANGGVKDEWAHDPAFRLKHAAQIKFY